MSIILNLPHDGHVFNIDKTAFCMGDDQIGSYVDGTGVTQRILKDSCYGHVVRQLLFDIAMKKVERDAEVAEVSEVSEVNPPDDFKLNSEQWTRVLSLCDDTAGMLVKESTIRFLIEKHVNDDRISRALDEAEKAQEFEQ